MAVMEEKRSASDLTREEKLAVATWQLGKAGWDDGAEFYGRRIRNLPIETKLRLATDTDLDQAWEARERRRCEDPTYFITQYGSVQPEEGPPVPFDLWDRQRIALEVIVENRRVVVLKARQLGLTWLALHYAIWLMAFNPATPKAKVLVLSKIGADADALIERARKLVARLPGFLRPNERHKWRDSNSRFVLSKGSEMRSLMGTVAAARSYTATFVICDEFAFYRNQQAGGVWSAVVPTLGELGRICVISTGNGEAGDGAAFAQLWNKPEEEIAHVFLSNETDPRRQAEQWRANKRKEFLTQEDFDAEYPDTPDQAFMGTGAFKVYPRRGIDAALALGAHLDLHLAELAVDGVQWGIDWGDFQTFALWTIALPNGGIYVFDELVQAHIEPAKAAEAIVFHPPAGMPGAKITQSFADSAPAGTNKTFGRVLREAYNAQPERYPSTHYPIDFAKYKSGGNSKQGVDTVKYIVSLLDAAEGWSGDPLEASGLIAVSPRCNTLATQMRNLEKDAETGKVRKPTLDPRHIERGDHGPDALVARMATVAAKWRASMSD